MPLHYFQFHYPFACFQPPAVCTYQRANLSIQVIEETNNTVNVIPITTRTYSGEPSEVSVVYGSADGLMPNAEYSVLAVAESVTGSVSAEATFGKLHK